MRYSFSPPLPSGQNHSESCQARRMRQMPPRWLRGRLGRMTGSPTALPTIMVTSVRLATELPSMKMVKASAAAVGTSRGSAKEAMTGMLRSMARLNMAAIAPGVWSFALAPGAPIYVRLCRRYAHTASMNAICTSPFLLTLRSLAYRCSSRISSTACAGSSSARLAAVVFSPTSPGWARHFRSSRPSRRWCALTSSGAC